MLIDSHSLKKELKNPNFIIIDSRSYKEYSSGHIPGSINLDLFAFHWIDTSKEGLQAFNTQMQKIFSNGGITQESQVVFYDEISGMLAARGVWLLLYFSHPKVLMLDGGFTKWKKNKFPIEKKTNPFKPKKFMGKTNPELIAGYQYIKDNLKRIKLVDARTKEEYEGSVARAAHKGHIPNAINVDWTKNIKKDGTLKNKSELEKLYQFSKNEEIITYCQGAYRAANTFVAMKKAGFTNVRVYLGSWGEWGNNLDLPVS